MDEIITKKCKKCGGTDFNKYGKCKTCRAVYAKRYYVEHRKETLARSKLYRIEHPEKHNALNRKYYAEHPEEVLACNKKWRVEHPEEVLACSKKWRAEHLEECRADGKKYRAEHQKEKRAYRLMHEYGMTIEEYDNLFTAQNGVCAICGLPQSSKRLFVDHSHETGKLRGLLCRRCNIVLGIMEDSTQLLIKAVDYLTKDNQR